MESTHLILKELIEEIKNCDSEPLRYRSFNDNFKKTRERLNGTHYVNDSFRKMLYDTSSNELYAKNFIVKEYIFENLMRFFLTSNDDSYKKDCLEIIDQLISLDFNDESLSFRDTELAKFYESKFINFIDELTDLTIEQTFFKDDVDEESSIQDFQDYILSLTRYVLKSISLKKLYKMGFKHRHVQFLIINFTKSSYIPKIIEALTSNFENSNFSNEDDLTVDNSSFLNTVNLIYLTALKSMSLLFKLHIHHEENLNIIIKTNGILINFYESHVKNNSEELRGKLWIGYFGKVISYFSRKMFEESEKNYRRLKFTLISYYMKIIKIYYSNLSKSQRDEYTEKLIYSIKKILVNIEQSRNFRALLDDELITKTECFLLIKEIIKISGDNFVNFQLKNFVHIWLNEIKIKNLCSIECLIPLFKIPNKKLSDFSMKLIEILNQQIEKDINVENLQHYAMCVENLFEFESLNFQLEDYGNNLIELVLKVQRKINEITSISGNDALNVFVCFNKSILFSLKLKRLVLLTLEDETAKTTLEEKLAPIFIQIFIGFERIIHNSFKDTITSQVYKNYFELIKLIIDEFHQFHILKSFKSTIYEMIAIIQSKLKIETTNGLNTLSNILSFITQ
ncbi:unnamed protein product [Brachionus calyciflorus]|uniref:Uncharacterized protein n=1 Tax=Brachionus calyciflorus TaxID=104777 RepID=A0A813MH97_9BILA|nr:unnamed protein product [Brachionus calyciflorus]